MKSHAPLIECLGLKLDRGAGGRLTHYGRRGDLASCAYLKLQERGETIADGLLTLGIEPGERVGVSLPSGIDFFAVIVGCALAQIALVPLPIELFGGFQPGHADRVHQIKSVAGIRKTIGTGDDCLSVAAILTAALGRRSFPEPRSGAPAVVQFTSGSTCNPKGAVLTQENVAANVRAIVDAVNMRPADTVDLWLPLSHDMGLIGSLAGICSGANLRVCAPTVFLANPFGWLLRFAAARSTISPAPHFAYRLMVDEYDPVRANEMDLSAWRVAFNGAEPIVADDLMRFQTIYGAHGFSPAAMLPVYGMAEATLAITFPPHGTAPMFHSSAQGRKYVGVGRPIGGSEVLLKPLTIPTPTLPRGAGEIHFRGPSLMQGYMLPGGEIEPARDSQGFFATGDIGFEIDGSLFICGRTKEVIIVRARHYFPHELESAARSSAHLEGSEFTEVAAFQPYGSEDIILLVESRRSPEDMSERLLKLGGDLSRTFGITVTAIAATRRSIPKTTSGKIQRLLLAYSWNSSEAAIRSTVAVVEG